MLLSTIDGNGSRGATWGPDGTIIYATNALTSGLCRVSAGGGTPTVLTRPDPAQGEADHVWPEFLPGGQSVLFTITPTRGGSRMRNKMVSAMLISALVTIALAFGSADDRAAADAVFVGRTPCGAEVRRFLGIPPKAPCEFIAWNLALSTDGTPRVKIAAVYGVGVPNQPGFEGGGTAEHLAGSWTVRHEAGAAAESVYQLTIEGRQMEFRKLAENLLHPLNSRGTLMVGNSGWSHTLTAENPSTVQSQRLTLEPVSESPPGLAGVFEGRTPCAALAQRLAIGAERGCTKLKWRLTLHQDKVTRAPTGYVLEGTAFRQAPRTGRWSVVKSKVDPKRLIYRLDADGPAAFLSFLRADEHILLFMSDDGGLLPGDSYFSYTLNRVTPQALKYPRSQ